MTIATIKYQIATYSGTVDVYCDPATDDNEVLFARAKKELSKNAPLPIGCERYEVVCLSSDE